MPRWKIILGILAVAIVLPGSCSLVLASKGERRWQEMEAEVVRLRRELAARTRSRPVLRGEAEPGSPWEFYLPALEAAQLLRGRGNDYSLLSSYAASGRDVDPVKVEQTLDLYAGEIERLRAGTWRAYRPPDSKLKQDFFYFLPTAMEALAVKLHETGRGREAAELLLDLCVFVQDLACYGDSGRYSTAGSNFSGAMNELRLLMETGALTRADLDQVAQALDILDRTFVDPGWTEFEDLVLMGERFLRSESLREDIRDYDHPRKIYPWHVWKYGFHYRLMAADAFFRSRDLAKAAVPAVTLPWPEAEALRRSLLEQMAQDPNPLVQARSRFGGVLWALPSARAAQAQLRLLRVGIPFKLHGEVMELQDPFAAGPLRHQVQGNSLKVWSLGRNGVDDLGQGGFRRTNLKDVTLDVVR